MFYVYILQSKVDNQLYIGCTNNLKKRFKYHNDGKSFAKEDAFARERYLKTGWGRNYIRKTLKRFLSLKI